MPGLYFNDDDVAQIQFNGEVVQAGFFNGQQFWPKAPQQYTIHISANANNINLRQLFNSVNSLPINSTDTIIFIQGAGVVVGSGSIGNHALDTGDWPEAPSLKYQLNNGYIVGKGGDGGSIKTVKSGALGSKISVTKNPTNGGPALMLRADIEFSGDGIIGGGGGGGACAGLAFPQDGFPPIDRVSYIMSGGGGAGANVGIGGDTSSVKDNWNGVEVSQKAADGTLTTGGYGVELNTYSNYPDGPTPSSGNRGGALGEDGASYGAITPLGFSGAAIEGDNYYSESQDASITILGARI